MDTTAAPTKWRRGQDDKVEGTMGKERRLLCVQAHPGDESLRTGGALARYAADGVATSR